MNIFRRDFVKLAAGGLVGAAPLLPGAATMAAPAVAPRGRFFNVKEFGAAGNGTAIDTSAINRAIAAAADDGGGTIYFPAGTYLSYSIRLKSHIALYLDPGAVILSASVPLNGISSGGYDAAESNAPWEAYQDFGHNHWHNSLIWGEGIENVSICGPGLIWGKNLSRGGKGLSVHDQGQPPAELPGVGNKAIALRNCRNVLLRDFSILQGGHMGILATGVDNLTLDNIMIDTNRDGMDIDCCRNVRITNCSVNSPWDDGICLKSSFSLGYARATENVTIAGCYVTGAYELGSLLDGSFRKFRPGGENGIPTGRIKCGTSSNGGFKNIAISNCVFDSCRGVAIECVDGGSVEDITVTGITMRNITNTPIFLRLGSRLSAPKGTTTGTMRRIIFSDIVSSNSVSEYAVILSGVPGYRIEDIKISNVYLEHQGGGTAQMASFRPLEQEAVYPDPKMFGPLPVNGFFLRHVRNIELTCVEIAAQSPDARPVMWLEDVEDSDFFRLKVPRQPGAPVFVLKDCSEFTVSDSRGIENISLKNVTERTI
jgi:polygalacturonase